MDREIKLEPIYENGQYRLMLSEYELNEIMYALEKVKKMRESSRKAMAMKRVKTEGTTSNGAGRKLHMSVVISPQQN